MSGILSAFIGRVAGVVTDAYFNLVTLLLPGNGTNGAQNNTFLDSSSNNFTITRNGNTTQGTFSPFSQTGWSNYFDGNGDYLNTASNAVFAFGTGDFTIEAWINPSSLAADTLLCGVDATGGAILGYSTTTVWLGSRALSYDLTATYTLSLNTWTHIAVSRQGTTARIFANGVQIASGTVTNNYAQGQFAVGNYITTNIGVVGYLSNVRAVKGTAVYTSAFTPSTSPLTAITNTSILTCQNNRFIDNSSNGFALTVSGTPSVQAFSPFAPTAAYSAATVGGSGYFDGTGDYLSTPDNAAFDLGTGDFTFECWVYKPNNNDGAFICSAGNGLEISYVSGSLRIGRFGVAWDVTQLYTIPQNAWTHIAFTKASGRTYIFANGALLNAGGTANTNTYDTTTTLYVGVAGDTTSRIFNGYMAGVRLIKGQSLATANFTPPTAPVTISTVGWTGAASSITGTVSLLLNYANAGITDATAKNVLETGGNAQISTTQSKFGGSSMYFDGTGDYLIAPASPNNNLNIGDFTLEFWVYRANLTGDVDPIGCGNSSNTGYQVRIKGTTGFVQFLVVGGASITTTTGISATTWTHIAIVRSGTTVKIYINGTDAGGSGTVANSGTVTTELLVIGANRFDYSNTLNGYIDDLRITRGYARYTANFTAPTAAFPLQ